MKMGVARLGQDVVSNAVRLNNSFVKMQIRASKLARKHFYSLLHPEARPLGRCRQDPLIYPVSLYNPSVFDFVKSSSLYTREPFKLKNTLLANSKTLFQTLAW
ncbi:MAG: hypothetical protein IJO25_01595, partial [Clostridia bacterium]|nr:hypothetical protein [Clostridia bacterium]